jgi:Na+/H+-dicarboxylate symporter/ABC-type amino acid transport substrate-binding protein
VQRRLLIGLVAGVVTGVFLGERARVFQAAADGFVKLLQMAVLPYVTVSIVGSIGALNGDDLRRLGARAVLVLVALWTLALAFAFAMPFAFPEAQSGSFFSTTLLERPPPFSLIDLYIPANPFFALANNVVPAVVVFSMVVGVALIGVPRKHALLNVLAVASDALSRAMGFVVHLTPYGLFAIAATTAGTIRLEQAARLEIYLIAYAALAVLFALWALPALVSAVTPIPAREIFTATREALLTATIAGDLFIVLPVLIASCRQLVIRHHPGQPDTAALPDIIVPVSYNFPHAGKLLSASFILFAGWFADAPIPAADYPRLAVTALVTLFGSVTSAVPFLLDAFRVPGDTYQLFVASGVINSRFGTLVAAMHTVATALLASCAVAGTLRLRPRPLLRYAATTVALAAAALAGTHLAAVRILQGAAAPADALSAMTVQPRAEGVALDDVPPPRERREANERLRAILASRTIRVGHLSDALPYAFRNGTGDLIGLDVALMHRLARELEVRLEFVPIDRSEADAHGTAPELLRAGACDVIVGGMAVTTERAGRMRLSAPYLEENLGFLVPDRDRRRFESWEAIRDGGPVTIAVPDVPYYVDRLRARLPDAQLLPVATVEALFAGGRREVDAFAVPAERGSAWTLRYPQFAMVVPPGATRIPLALAMPRGESDLATFVDTWLDLKRRDGTIDELYAYWILGRGPVRAGPRWSIIADVLGWAD